jgi:PRTRC genetic system protein F
VLNNLKTTGNSKNSRKDSVPRSVRRKRQTAGQRKRFIFPAPFVAHLATPALSLPNIAAIPTKLIHQKSVEATSKIALALIDMGLACDEDAPLASTPALFVERVFQRWITQKTIGIKNLSPHFVLTDSLETFEEPNKSDTHIMAVGISYSDGDAEFFSLQNKIEALEKAVPGLGETALHTLYTWLCRTTLSITPDFVYSLVQHHYWYGADDEKGYIEEMVEMGEDVDDLEIPVTLADFERDFPKHVYWASEKIKKNQLKKLVKHDDRFVAETARLLLSEPNCAEWDEDNRPNYLNDLESDSDGIGYAAVLNWQTGGSSITNQVCDDWINYAYQSNCTELYAVYQFNQDREGAERLFNALEQFITALTWADRAISHLTEPEP